MTFIVALDLATVTGVAVGRPCSVPECSTHVLGKTATPHGERFLNGFKLMRQLIDKHKPTHIVLEAPIGTAGGGSKRRPEVLMGLRGCVMAAAHYDRVGFIQYEVLTIRAHFLGPGGGALKRAAAKAATMAECLQRGWEIHGSEDEADAAALWDYACTLQSGEHGVSTTPLFR